MFSDFYKKAAELASQGKSFAIATVVRVEGSSLRTSRLQGHYRFDGQTSARVGWRGLCGERREK
jgi:xanthine/CO dehydrogenase XdhC/CoxF family maturation factor